MFCLLFRFLSRWSYTASAMLGFSHTWFVSVNGTLRCGCLSCSSQVFNQTAVDVHLVSSLVRIQPTKRLQLQQSFSLHNHSSVQTQDRESQTNLIPIQVRREASSLSLNGWGQWLVHKSRKLQSFCYPTGCAIRVKIRYLIHYFKDLKFPYITTLMFGASSIMWIILKYTADCIHSWTVYFHRGQLTDWWTPGWINNIQMYRISRLFRADGRYQ